MREAKGLLIMLSGVLIGGVSGWLCAPLLLDNPQPFWVGMLQIATVPCGVAFGFLAAFVVVRFIGKREPPHARQRRREGRGG
jgi:hypothetical protein